MAVQWWVEESELSWTGRSCRTADGVGKLTFSAAEGAIWRHCAASGHPGGAIQAAAARKETLAQRDEAGRNGKEAKGGLQYMLRSRPKELVVKHLGWPEHQATSGYMQGGPRMQAHEAPTAARFHDPLRFADKDYYRWRG